MSSNLNERLKEKEDLFRETQVMLRRMQQILSQKKNELDPLEKAVSENPDDHDVQRRLYKAQVEVQESEVQVQKAEVEVQEAKVQVQKAEVQVQEAKVETQEAKVEALRNQPDRVEDFQEASRQLKTLRRLLDVYRGALADQVQAVASITHSGTPLLPKPKIRPRTANFSDVPPSPTRDSSIAKLELKLAEMQLEMKQTNEKVQQTNERVQQTNERVQQTNKTVQQTKEIMEKLQRRADLPRGSVTRAELYQNYESNKRILHQLVNWLPEIATPTDFVKHFEARRCTQGTSEKRVQSSFNEAVNSSKLEEHNSELHDRHTQASIGTLQPDCPAYLKKPVAGCCELLLSFFVELKKVKPKFEEKDKGQVLDTAMRLLNLLPLRQHVDCVLMDMNRAIFFRLQRDGTDFLLLEGPPLDLTEAVPFLHCLLMMSTEQHGMKSVGALPEGLRLCGYLGQGASSTAWEGEFNKEAVVVKVRYDEKTDYEDETLKDLQERGEKDLLRLIPTVVTNFDCGIVLKPKATPLKDAAEWTGRALVGVVDVLRAMHSFGYIHLDVSVFNILVVDRDWVILNDFGSCWKEGRQIKGWTDQFATDSILRATENKQDLPLDERNDLHAFIRCLYVMLCGGLSTVQELALRGREQRNYQELREFWGLALGAKRWQELAAAADLLAYDKLKVLVQELIVVYHQD